MPWIVATKRLGTDPTRKYSGAPSVSRRAVAALEVEPLADILRPQLRHSLKALEWVDMMNALTALPESGGSVGTLPDGSLITVELVDIMRLWREAGEPDTTRTEVIIAAFNAKQATP